MIVTQKRLPMPSKTVLLSLSKSQIEHVQTTFKLRSKLNYLRTYRIFIPLQDLDLMQAGIALRASLKEINNLVSQRWKDVKTIAYAKELGTVTRFNKNSEDQQQQDRN